MTPTPRLLGAGGCGHLDDDHQPCDAQRLADQQLPWILDPATGEPTFTIPVCGVHLKQLRAAGTPAEWKIGDTR